jgi:type IV pilus assembly protein PilQ
MNKPFAKRTLARYGASVVCLLLVLMPGLGWAAQIESLSWSVGTKVPSLEILMDGDATYKVETRENGQWLRLTFPATKLGAHASDLDGVEHVKGVYPSMDPDGNTAHVDIVLDQPGRLNVEKTAFGYSAAVESALAQVAASSPTVPAAASASAATPAPAAAAPTNEISDIVYVKLPGNRIQIVVRMTAPPSEPSSFSITNPARVALDFPATRVTAANKVVQVREGAVSSVTAVEGDGRSRVVLSLIKPVGYTTSIDGNNYVITVNAPTTAIGAAEQAKVVHFASSRQSGKYSLKSIDFRRGPQAGGNVVIKLSDPSVGVDIREQTGEIIVDFLNTSVPLDLQRRLDVVDFATPVQTIDTFAQGRNTRMIITPKGRYEHVAYQTGDIFTVSVKPVIEKPNEKKVDEFGYSGEKLSLNFQNIDVRAALQVLADFTGLNFVVSDSVKGNLTLRLKDVPWDQALDLIVDAKNLAVRRKGNVITVAPAPEVAAKEKAALESSKANVELEPLVSELIQINYAKAEDIAALLKSVKAVTAGPEAHPVFGYGGSGTSVQATTESNSLLSPRGQVTVDQRTNSLLIQDTPGKIREVRKLIAKLDQPVRQVLIETRLVEATDNFARSLGVRFGVKNANVANAGRHDGAISGNIEDTTSIITAGTLGADTNGLNVNLASAGIGGSPAASIGFTLAKLGATGDLLNLELSALEQEGNGKIISSPRVITANQKKATIEQGQERVFTTNVLGVGSVVTKRATLKLDVTPQITPDDRVNLDVDITKDNFADAVQGLLNVKEVKTTVLLDNGETVVIGGIYEQDKNTTISKVPFFGDLPLLGWLFKSKDTQDNKTELLIFLTPRIVSENLSLK